MSSKFSLLVSIPDDGPVTYDLNGDSISLGRGPENDIQILVAEVSVKHGEFKADGDGYQFFDLGSSNGTQVNGAKVEEGGKALSPMDRILLGATINAYFVSTEVLAATPVEELIESINASSKEETKDETAKVAIAAPMIQPVPAAPVAKPVVAVVPAAPGAASAGAVTVKLDKVKPSVPVPGPVKPSGAVKPPKVVTDTKTEAPVAPKVVSPVPLKRPNADDTPAAPAVPLPNPSKVKPD